MTDAERRKRAGAVYVAHYKPGTTAGNWERVIDSMLAFADEEVRAAIERCENDYGWSLVRRILEQGAAIQQDYQAGKYPSYEHYSARMDEAARERADAIAKLKEKK